MEKKTVLIIQYMSLPQDIREEVCEWLGFSNDCLLSFSRRSEFTPRDLSQAELESYHRDQVSTNGFEGDLPKFIEEYGLKFETWLIAQDLDLNVDELLIEVSW